jgi:hypothetical protein
MGRTILVHCKVDIPMNETAVVTVSYTKPTSELSGNAPVCLSVCLSAVWNIQVIGLSFCLVKGDLKVL